MEKAPLNKVFIVDDDNFNLSWYTKHVSDLGRYAVSSFDNEHDLLNALIDKPQIIFLDHNPGSMTGIELLKRIKRFEPSVVVIFITGQDNMHTALNALKFGAFDYIVKGSGDLERITNVLQRVDDARKLKPRRNNDFMSFIAHVFV
jgi:polysaccharide export outer membrane protein